MVRMYRQSSVGPRTQEHVPDGFCKGNRLCIAREAHLASATAKA